MDLARIQVMGLAVERISSVFVNGKEIAKDQFHYNKEQSVSKFNIM